MAREYQICNRCVMDTTDPDIIFDENGYCNHCTNAIKRLNEIYFIEPEVKKQKLDEIVNKIKLEGKNKKYDCIIGLSGGVDSSYLAYLVVKELGLRPLAVHLDNAWDSELAVKNIDNIVNKLSIDLYTYVINWEEFRDLQVAFLQSGVVDLEMLSDNAIVVSIFNLKKKYKIKNFIDGTNISSESIMPQSWYYSPKYDSCNIKSIYKKFGNNIKLKTYPMLSFWEYIAYHYFKKGKSIALLNYINYDKNTAKKILINEYCWRDYGGKHYESKITHFYQAYLLPKKFNIDKRKAHLSSLICSGQISREIALQELAIPLYDPVKLNEDIAYFKKKIGLMNDVYLNIIMDKPHKHFDYSAYHKIHNLVTGKIKEYYK